MARTTHDTPALQLGGRQIPSLFWQWHVYPRRFGVLGRPPLTETSTLREVEEPFRVAHGRVVRIPLTRGALIVGVWHPDPGAALEEQEAAWLASPNGHYPTLKHVSPRPELEVVAFRGPAFEPATARWRQLLDALRAQFARGENHWTEIPYDGPVVDLLAGHLPLPNDAEVLDLEAARRRA